MVVLGVFHFLNAPHFFKNSFVILMGIIGKEKRKKAFIS
jgi:hypothetical protein